MKKPSLFLFFLRLFFYLSAVALPVLHPGIPVSYDRPGLVHFFLVIPLSALLAFLPALKGRLRNKFITAALVIIPLSVWAGGFSAAALYPIFAGAAVFILTLLLFHYPRWGKLSVLEPFLFAWICLRLLAFSRSGEDAAGESLGITQFILVWTAVIFLFHSVVVYFCLNHGSRGGAGSEAAVFGLTAAAILILVLFVLPADFIRNSIIENLLPDQRDRMISSDDSERGIPEDSGNRREGRRTIPNSGDNQKPSLRSLSEHDWPGGNRSGRDRSNRGDGGGQSRQYTVMVVASKFEPVYMGSAFRGKLDPVEGFLPSPEEALNRLQSQRLFVTWFDNEQVFDLGRQRHTVFSLSTLAMKFLPYRPYAIEPTILSENTGPFRYIHYVVSNVHPEDPFDLLSVPVRDLSSREKANLAPYLELSLADPDRAVFSAHLDRVLENWELRRNDIMGDFRNEYIEKILAILLGFSDFQYNVTDNNTHTIAHLVDFMVNTKDGDCVEFSNTAALLARFAGIPSRVVTGYLAADGLQTETHVRGLATLRSRIPILQEYPLQELYLVTDAHGHSWPQFYIPGYGWIDFEATTFAIPPIGFGDANLRDVVIPLLDANQVFAPVRAFPWRAVLTFIAILAIAAIAGAYILRYGREIILYRGSLKGGREGARSLYLLLLAKLAADGKPIKPVSKTAPEYARLFPEETGSFASFAKLYSELRWREYSDKDEMGARFELLGTEYRNILSENRRRGIHFAVIRVFSLRPLAYL